MMAPLRYVGMMELIDHMGATSEIDDGQRNSRCGIECFSKKSDHLTPLI